MKAIKILMVAFLIVIPELALAQDLHIGLVGYWPINGNANDESGNSHDGIVNGATLATDRNGIENSAYNMNGTSDYINIDSSIGALSTTTQGSWSAWINVPVAASGSNKGVLNFIDVETVDNAGLIVLHDGKIAFTVNSGSVQWLWFSTNPVADTTWMHLAVTQDGTQPLVYLDGSLMPGSFYVSTNLTAWINDIPGTIDDGRIGLHAGVSFFDGLMDEVAIWDRALTATEIQQLFNDGIPDQTSTPQICNVIYCDENSVGIGTEVRDALLTVNGTIHSKEIRVDLNVPGPDFVFDEDYKLLELSELQDFIVNNKHLPLIPPAKRMKKEGIDLGEMNMLLLQKVEELTLYMIDHEKRLNAIDPENNNATYNK